MVMAKGAKLVIPPFLAKKKLNRKSFTYEEAVTQRITTRGRVHIERYVHLNEDISIISLIKLKHD